MLAESRPHVRGAGGAARHTRALLSEEAGIRLQERGFDLGDESRAAETVAWRCFWRFWRRRGFWARGFGGGGWDVVVVLGDRRDRMRDSGIMVRNVSGLDSMVKRICG